MPKCCLPALVVLASVPTLGAQTPHEIIKVRETVYAFVHPFSGNEAANGNAGIIITDDGVVIVDATLTPASAAHLVRELRKITPKPVRFLINTHWHDDHVLGNKVIADAYPGLQIISHTATKRAIIGQVVTDLAKNRDEYPKVLARSRRQLEGDTAATGARLTDDERARLRRRVDVYEAYIPELLKTEVKLPNVTIDGELILHLAGTDIHIVHLGRGNTHGDLVVHLPNEGVVFTGDLLVAPVPFGFGSFIGDWIETLARVRALGASTIIPGHGGVQHDVEYLNTVIAALSSLLNQANEAVRRNLTLEQFRAELDLSVYRSAMAGSNTRLLSWFSSSFATPASERAYREARGEW